MTPPTPFGAGVARRLLELLSPDGAPLHSDLLEAYARRRRRSGRLACDLWFGREVLTACCYGVRDTWTDRAVRGRFVPRLEAPTHALRALRRRQGYSLTVVVLTAVAAGTLGSLTGVIRVIGRAPGPGLEDVRVLVGTDSGRGWPVAYLSPPEIEDVERAVPDLADVGVFLANVSLGLRREGRTRPVSVVFADDRYFEVLGAAVRLGRTFTEAEGMGREGPFVLLSNGLWREAFGEDPAVVGTSVDIAGRSYEVLGVVDEDFHDLGRSAETDVWLPLGEVWRTWAPARSPTAPADA